jgi:DNA invertase Pin-like site-specific DNA recombinase
MATKKQSYNPKLIVEDYIQGHSGKSISKKYDISETTVYRILDNQNVIRRDSGIVFTEEQVQDIISLYENGFSMITIGKRFGVSKTAVKRVLLNNSIRIKESKEYKKNWDDDVIAKIITDYKLELPTTSILNNYNISAANLRYVIRKNKIQQRNASQSARQYRINENYFNVVDDRNKAYILGLMYADGCSFSNTVSISLHKNDIELLNKIQALIYVDLSPIKINADNSTTLYLHCKQIREDLEYKWGICPNKSLKLNSLPEINSEYYSDFIRGYFDGDGHISAWTNNKGYFLTNVEICGTYDFLSEIQKVLISELGLNQTKIYPTPSKIFVLKYGGRNNVKKIRNFLYQNVDDSSLLLLRKFNKFNTIN